METKGKNYEIELKFKVSDPIPLKKKLRAQKAKFVGKAFEKTIRFDTPDRRLSKTGRFLRLRTGFADTITFKRKVENKEFKKREEIELEISDPGKMKKILENLGFTNILIMEKYREKWLFKNTEIVIDRLPMGTFIEIEGDEKSIKKVTSFLGIDLKEKIITTYWDIWKEFSKKNNIKGENIVF